ncbi:MULTISPECIES: HAD family phosphatase [Streptomyces]|uniref:HAD family phosphatase n=1 Tax=Streptomyces rhizosphaericola TaxID=2564098 RepID=A0ABY2PMI9_9ACTN|nr:MULTISPECIES: HAD family phosphatase [Streptomyces]ARI51665.1 hydrolase [Streptomyces sp. S8]MYU01578.1 HAD-IA family hydrolase [Streptomyces sp. SID8350]NGO82128.1 HAD-IA family hydrolase [Streptomyces sp. 196(2019)]TGZ12117.1 HAD family phosphatase [Streptomyces rhizosphaericola]SCK26359.1 haloacid dehalogenase superfamily, subfamily IA, variant 3 with third motif having DD or ED [Streptomyces sp. AmelKG-D3]
MTITEQPFRGWSPEAVVFDCDGTLMDTEEHWQDARRRAFREFGLRPAPGFAERAKGVHYLDCGRMMAEEADKAHLAPELTESLLAHFMERVAEDPVTMPGAAEFVRSLSGRLPLAVASNCPLAVVERSLERAGLLSHFGHIVVPGDPGPTGATTGNPDGGTLIRPKPWPDVYATAARLCGARSERTLAVEDSLTGIESARRAGLRVVGVGDRPADGRADTVDLWVPTLNAPELLELDWVRPG